jgi:hypothetical protein
MIIRHIIVYTRYRRRGLFYTDSYFETAFYSYFETALTRSLLVCLSSFSLCLLFKINLIYFNDVVYMK